MTVREQTEAIEAQTLSPHACLARDTRGRARPEALCDVRTDFQRDRDRIIHQCKAFRRLAYKTQCFMGQGLDHVRTRLTHTLEVAQIARTAARCLRLNEDLTEAIALGHDLGHTPFGHTGEYALDLALREVDPTARFHHAEHSLRVVDVLDNDGRGVNLTEETRNGIRYHSKAGRDFAPEVHFDELLTLEAHLIKWADRVAYVNHDLDDALRGGVIEWSRVPACVPAVLGERHSQRINTLVLDLAAESQGSPRLRMTEDVCEALNELKRFLYANVYLGTTSVSEDHVRAQRLVARLFEHYLARPEEASFLAEAERELPAADRARATADYVAGMTDRFAVSLYVKLTVPEGYL
jgi:dGTPase